MLDITWNQYVRNVNKTGVQQFFLSNCIQKEDRNTWELW